MKKKNKIILNPKFAFAAPAKPFFSVHEENFPSKVQHTIM